MYKKKHNEIDSLMPPPPSSELLALRAENNTLKGILAARNNTIERLQSMCQNFSQILSAKDDIILNLRRELLRIKTQKNLPKNAL